MLVKGKNMNKNIVIIDDEELILKSLVREFTPLCTSMDVTMFTFTSASEAMFFLSQSHESTFLVISDLRMPEKSGSQLLQEIKNLYPNIKLFLLTAHSDIQDIQEAVKASILRLLIKPWDHDDLKSSIINAFRCYSFEQENRELKKELELNMEIAGDFQKKLLMNPDFSSSSMAIDMKYIPVQKLKCGGDYFEFISLNNNEDLIMLGDVSGHGIKPAFVTSMLKVLTSNLRPDLYKKDFNLGEMLSQINFGLFKSLGHIKDIITTYTAVLIDSDKKTMKISGAGQLPIYILRNNTLKCIKKDSPAMGFIHDFQYQEIKEKLETDDLIIMFTDGLIESEKSRSIIDNNRIQSLIIGLDLDEDPAEKILSYFQKLQKDNSFADDVTLITARIL